MKPCKHLWVNMEGCLLCGANWKKLHEEGYIFKPINAPVLSESEKK